MNGKSDTVRTSEPVLQKDIMDVIRNVRKRKNADSTKVSEEPMPGKVLYSVVPAVGYTLSTGFTGIISANAALYLSNPASTNISSISSSFNYTQYNQIMVPVLANIWTKNNGYNIVIDWRFFKYPQNTYGLGGHSVEINADNIDYQHLRLHQSVLKRVGNAFYAGLGYFMDYRWRISEYDSNSDVTQYGLTRTSMSSGMIATLSYDSRKNSINPEKGLFANIQYRPNMTLLGSNTNWQSLTVDIRKYIHFPAGSRNVLALWNYNWLTLSGKPPYLDLPSTGWDPFNNTGRGYIQGRFRSPNMLYLESEYRFELTRNGLLGGVVFANAQSFSNWPALKYDRIAPATGLGLRIKVNKTSRTNIAVDYGFGLNGSRGLFVNLGEVF
ncbi:hypothetical protein DYBT9275_04974 [Dyadobacter sp. CECT 9275]|uniref:Bacterial surface antigen (D15) domain-containing protein n=2 Tax=Dyadobacter helix TaxID=2822344 RepID=A0A916JFE2_9BACT|nr:hypothetical protein DYBT9275_04974 [Dyadobacter sp. CECT 9275]